MLRKKSIAKESSQEKRPVENGAAKTGNRRKRALKTTTRSVASRPGSPASIQPQIASALDWLKAHSSRATLLGMARYAIPSDHALGVTMKDVKALGKQLGRNHSLALALWGTGCYEARLLTSFVADPALLSAQEMNDWCADFDNWAICDTLCFNLFDRTPHAWAKVTAWSGHPGEFQKRAAFALLWSLALHDKTAPNAAFVKGLKLVELAATDDRNFVKKAVNMALRAIARRPALRAQAIKVATRLASASEPAARWIGKDALRALPHPIEKTRGN